MSQLPHERPADSPRRRKSFPVQPTRREIPRYRLVLHSSAVKDMMFVVHTIMDLTRFCLAEATHKMWAAHHYGRSPLLVTYRERAELYVEQFAARGLAISLEPV